MVIAVVRLSREVYLVVCLSGMLSEYVCAFQSFRRYFLGRYFCARSFSGLLVNWSYVYSGRLIVCIIIGR